MNFIRSKNLSFKFQRFIPSDCKDIGIRKLEFFYENRLKKTHYDKHFLIFYINIYSIDIEGIFLFENLVVSPTEFYIFSISQNPFKVTRFPAKSHFKT